MRSPSNKRIGLEGLVMIAVLALAGCAGTPAGEIEEPPAHPFPRWVAHLETGRSDVAEVRVVFGDPAEIEQHHRRGLVWRYAYPEVRWTANDPDRPRVAADGTLLESEPDAWDRVVAGVAATGRFLDRLLFYPATRVAQPSSRVRPATIHDLELAFSEEGVLEHLVYVPRSGFVRLPPER